MLAFQKFSFSSIKNRIFVIAGNVKFSLMFSGANEKKLSHAERNFSTKWMKMKQHSLHA